jgi:hypothetical protein
MRPYAFRLGAAILLLCYLVSSPIQAQWSSDPTVNTAICTWPGNQENVRITTDGSGGAIMVHTDRRSPTANWLYAQRVDGAGSLRWYPPGMALTTYNCSDPVIASDGMGGAIVAWTDARPGAPPRVYVQRINSSGTRLWGASTYGVSVTTGADQSYPSLVGDGAGGAIVAWSELPMSPDIRAQRFTPSGARAWTTSGITLCNAAGVQTKPVAVTDGAGGAIVAWQDGRGGISNYDVYAQRVNAAGVMQWAPNGVPVVTASGNQLAPVIDGDGGSGIVVAWTDNRSSLNQTIYAQRVNATGVSQWTPDGVLVSDQPHSQEPCIVGNGSGGAFIAWCDFRIFGYPGGLQSIWMQQLDATGSAMWAAEGVTPLKSADQFGPKMFRDGVGNVFIVWSELASEGVNVYAQRLSTAGERLWSDHTIVSAAYGGQYYAVPVSDGSDGAIIAWVDSRAGTSDLNVYAQRVLSTGLRAGPKGNIAGTVSSLGEGLGPLTISLLNTLGNRLYWVPTAETDADGHYLIPNVPPGSYQVAVFEPHGYDVDLNPKPVAVFADQTTTVDFSLAQTVTENASRIKAYWEHQFSVYVNHEGVAQETEEQLHGYLLEVAQHYTPHFRYFIGPTSFEQWLAFLKVPDDPPLFDLARAQVAALVLNFAALRVGQYTPVARDGRTAGDVLTYVSELLSSEKANEVAHAMVYSQHVNNRVMIRANAIPEGTILYKPGLDGPAGTIETPKSFALRDNYPNPFNPSTTISFELPKPSDVRLSVYDVLGREVSVLVNERKGVGVHKVKFDASGLPSGAYFCRLRAGDFMATRKLMLLK